MQILTPTHCSLNTRTTRSAPRGERKNLHIDCRRIDSRAVQGGKLFEHTHCAAGEVSRPLEAADDSSATSGPLRVLGSDTWGVW
jgi:hypothetical protein